MEDKQKLRKEFQQQLKNIARPEYEHRSYLIGKQLYSHKLWNQSSIIAITISRMPEVDTYQIIRKAWEENKRVVIPKCYPHDKTMKFRTLTAFNQLESVYFGLYEPIEDKTDEVQKNDIELIIVPGLAYTRQGYRLGFGGGYYDRYLQGYSGNMISLAFKSQVVDSLPIEEHDIPVHQIITEEETIKVYG